MRTKNEVQLTLLSELDSICRDNDITYFLHGEAARFAEINDTLKNGPDIIEVAMTCGDVEKFIRLVSESSPESRYVESLLTNPRFDQKYAVYGDENTAEIDIRKKLHRDHYGIHIRIYYIDDIAAATPSEKLKKSNKIWNTYNSNNSLNGRINLKRKKYIFLRTRIHFLGWKSLARARYEELHKRHAIKSFEDIRSHETVLIGARKFNSCLFDSGLERRELDGMELCFLKNPDGYFASYRGESWRREPMTEMVPNPYTAICTDESYRTVLERFEKNHVMSDAQTSYNKIFRERFMRSKVQRAAVEKTWHMVEMVRDQIQYEQFFAPYAAEPSCMKLEDPETASTLKRLVSTLRRYSELQLTFSLGDEMDDFIDSYMRDSGEEELADNVARIREMEILLP